MRKLTILLSGALLVSPFAAAQCTQMELDHPYSLNELDLQGAPGDQDAQDAVDDAVNAWNQTCPPSLGRPNIRSSGATGMDHSEFWYVTVSDGPSLENPTACGEFITDGPLGPTINLNRQAIGVTTRTLGNCPISETLEHEIGHLLNLDDVYDTACSNYLMYFLTGNQYLHQEECAAADEYNNTDAEDAPPPVILDPIARDPSDNSPIIIDFGSTGLTLSDPSTMAHFDIDGDGTPDWVTWVLPGGEDPFLAIDLNGDGEIADGRELFGSGSEIPGEGRAAHGFAALKYYDQAAAGGNEDGVISAEDAVWGHLLLWYDVDGNAQSLPPELIPIAQSHIVQINLHYQTIGRQDRAGNLLRLKSLCTLDAATAGGRQRAVYDVIFQRLVE